MKRCFAFQSQRGFLQALLIQGVPKSFVLLSNISKLKNVRKKEFWKCTQTAEIPCKDTLYTMLLNAKFIPFEIIMEDRRSAMQQQFCLNGLLEKCTSEKLKCWRCCCPNTLLCCKLLPQSVAKLTCCNSWSLLEQNSYTTSKLWKLSNPISHRFNVQILFLQKFTFVTLMIWYKSLFIKALPEPL